MSRTSVARTAAPAARHEAMNDLARVALDVLELHRQINLTRAAMLGAAHEITTLDVAAADVPSFVEPVQDSLENLVGKSSALVARFRDLGPRLHSLVCATK